MKAVSLPHVRGSACAKCFLTLVEGDTQNCAPFGLVFFHALALRSQHTLSPLLVFYHGFFYALQQYVCLFCFNLFVWGFRKFVSAAAAA